MMLTFFNQILTKLFLEIYIQENNLIYIPAAVNGFQTASFFFNQALAASS